jgi:hypothetical protein
MPAPNCLLLGFSLREAELRAQCLAAGDPSGSTDAIFEDPR